MISRRVTDCDNQRNMQFIDQENTQFPSKLDCSSLAITLVSHDTLSQRLGITLPLRLPIMGVFHEFLQDANFAVSDHVQGIMALDSMVTHWVVSYSLRS